MRSGAVTILLCTMALSGLRAQLRSDSLFLFENAPQPNRARIWTVAGGEAVALGGIYTGLYKLWYEDYNTGNFHLHNDNGNWQQVDKIGHAITSYYTGYAGMGLLRWAGVPHNEAVWYGGTLGMVFLTGIEVLDGYSEGWGFSWGDMAANAGGAGLLIGQELLWKEQRIVMKFSYHPTAYANEYPALLGENTVQRIFKDYNGHTYWLSANLRSLSGWGAVPGWLNLAAGYGADGMVTATYDRDYYDTRPDLEWQRQYYLSLDIDLRKIPVKNAFLKSLFQALNFVKIPLPTLEINQKGGVHFYPIYF